MFDFLTKVRQYLYYIPCLLQSGEGEEIILTKHNYYETPAVPTFVICYAFLSATSIQQEQLYFSPVMDRVKVMNGRDSSYCLVMPVTALAPTPCPQAMDAV